ncbi:MAG: RDD family protein [Mariprofundales bacterium]|nr:RDD family protein [Mariprofundales bacterium]
MVDQSRPKAAPAGVVVRLLSAGYDLLILFGLEFLIFIPITIVEQTIGVTPEWIKGVLVIAVAWAYLTGFWQRSGETTGMRPWSLRLAMVESGDLPTAQACAIRFVALMITWLTLALTITMVLLDRTQNATYALLGLVPMASMISLLVTPNRQPLHDLLAGTNVYRVGGN